MDGIITMTFEEEIKSVVSNYPGLVYNNHNRTLKGRIEINHIYCDEHIIATYMVCIKILDSYPQVPPLVTNIGMLIPYEFGHIFTDSTLCLATNADQQIFFADGHNISEWIECYVVPYYAAVEYFKKYKVYPFGERSHYSKGKLEFYAEIFNVITTEEAYKMLKYIVCNKYRGHALCPCSSGKKIRNCHKDIIIHWKQNKYRNILQYDYNTICKEINRRKE